MKPIKIYMDDFFFIIYKSFIDQELIISRYDGRWRGYIFVSCLPDNGPIGTTEGEVFGGEDFENGCHRLELYQKAIRRFRVLDIFL